MQMKKSTENWWNDADSGKPKDQKQNLSHGHFVHHNLTRATTMKGQSLTGLKVMKEQD
jgi:hypothetical protein